MPTTTIKDLKPIPPNPPRWKPTTDPMSIIVTGLDTTASINDQIDQIDQLITLKLQDIDADFSKMQQVLSSRILPAFKRYSIGTEPVREAAKFWTSFYEQAAQVRIPTSDDLSTLQEPSSTSPADQQQDATSHSRDPSSSIISSESNSNNTFDPNRTPSESSFLPAHAAISSTPAAAVARTRRTTNDTSFTPQPLIITDDPSWDPSIESPLVRLDRDLRELARTCTTSSPFHDPRSAAAQTHSTNHAIPPLIFRTKPTTPARNPYLPAHTNPRDWSGIVDLRSSPLQPTSAMIPHYLLGCPLQSCSLSRNSPHWVDPQLKTQQKISVTRSCETYYVPPVATPAITEMRV
ncbi:DASH complex subunit Ask1-domain-containing protein [Multifurca ochricompacta]|uniref:DASH complex subunit ASK1 n=1 Tax=Multifurca ochricompacta TaxID=376703 RepID=A0AAD4LZG7_9AGAM|nr:DASH complex subunit Ask1-domain-containing protein [Multifurca ochricompacta]